MHSTQQNTNQSQENKTTNMFYLWWFNKNSKKRFCAGRAFYSEKSGDFSMLINLLETSSRDGLKEELFLKPIQVADSNVYYRLEKVIHKGSKSHRFCIGEGFQNANTDGDIHILIEPLTHSGKVLVLSLGQQPDEKTAA